MTVTAFLTLGLLAVYTGVGAVGPTAIPLATAANYVILAETGVSTVAPSVITGNIGLSPAAGSYFTGFSLTLSPSGTYATSKQVYGDLFAASYVSPTPSTLTTAISDMQTAYTNGMGRSSPNYLNLDSGAIGGTTLTGGLYLWTTAVTASSSFTISGTATDTWIFQVQGTLGISPSVVVTLSGGAKASNVFWVVSGAITIGGSASFQGIILGKTAVTYNTGATHTGQCYAQTFVTLQTTTLTQT